MTEPSVTARTEALVAAARQGDLDTVIALHRRGIPLNGAAMIAAAAAGHLKIVTYLHQQGTDLKAIGEEALGQAVRGGHRAVARYLLQNGVALTLLAPESQARIREMQAEVAAAPSIYHPSKFWEFLGEVNNTLLGWGGESAFKRTINQNYFTFLPTSFLDQRVLRLVKWWLRHPSLAPFRYTIEDPDPDPGLWFSMDPAYFVFKGRHRFRLHLYRFFLGLLYEWALTLEDGDLLATLEEPALGRPIVVRRAGKVVSQDLVNSARERNALVDALERWDSPRPWRIAELGAGYGRLGHALLATTDCRYAVFDIPPALHVAEWYLSSLFPDRRIFRFRRFHSYAEIADELDASHLAFFTPNQLELLPNGYFGAFATISSLHEMRREQIDHFLGLMGHKASHVIYIKQQTPYVNPYDRLLITRDDYRLPEGWTVTLERPDEVNPGFFEIVARRALRPLRQPTISILLCNYNHAKYLSDSLGAICSQTAPPDEVIVVDDGSSDDSLVLIEGFHRCHPFVKVIRNGTNRGLMYSVQRALRHATGDYVAWAAADDRLLPTFVERNREILARHPGVGVSFSRLAVLEEDTGKIREYVGDPVFDPAFFLGDKPQCFSERTLVERLHRSYLWMSGNTVLARRDALLAAGGFRTELAWHADWFVFYVVALRHGACAIPETLALLREYPGTYSRSGMGDPRRQRKVLRALATTINSAAYRDLLPIFRARPTLLSPFGSTMLWVLLSNPRNWHLALGYSQWMLEHCGGVYRARADAGWPYSYYFRFTATLASLGARVLRALRPRLRVR